MQVLADFVPQNFYLKYSYVRQKVILYRVVRLKVYDRECSLNQLINRFFCYILFLFLYTYNSFLTNIFLKLIEKRVQSNEFCEIGDRLLT